MSIAFSPDGKWLASGGLDKSIRLWDVASGREARALTGHTDVILGVAFSPDGTLLASGGRDAILRLWDVVSGRQSGALSGGQAAGIDAVALFTEWKAAGFG